MSNKDPLTLLREARNTLAMWADVAPAVSLIADIDAALAAQPVAQAPEGWKLDRAKLYNAMDRMDLARKLLTDGNPRPECNWGMLDTSDLRASLAAAPSPEAQRLPGTWDAHSNSGMQYLEESDLIGGATDCEASKPVQAEAPSEQVTGYVIYKDGRPLTIQQAEAPGDAEIYRAWDEAGSPCPLPVFSNIYKTVWSLATRAAHSPASGVVERGVQTWQDRIKAAHPNSVAEHWPSDLKAGYMAHEIADLRAALATQPLEQKPVGYVAHDKTRDMTAERAFHGMRICSAFEVEPYDPACVTAVYAGPQPEQVSIELAAEVLRQCAQALEAAPALDAQGEASHDLRTRCSEILEWQKTGILKGEALRAYAAAKRYANDTHALQCAETDTSREAFELIVAAPPPPAVGKPLSEEQRRQITAMWNAQNRNYTVADIIDAVEAAHGIVTKESGT